MDKNSIEYTVYENCPRATKYATDREKIGTKQASLLFRGLGLAFFWYVITIYQFYFTMDFEYLLISVAVLMVLGALVIHFAYIYPVVTDYEYKMILADDNREKFEPAVVDAYIYKLKGNLKAEKRIMWKFESVLYVGVLLATFGIGGIVRGIYLLCHGKPGILLLLVACLGTGIIIFTTWILMQKVVGKKEHPLWKRFFGKAGKKQECIWKSEKFYQFCRSLVNVTAIVILFFGIWIFLVTEIANKVPYVVIGIIMVIVSCTIHKWKEYNIPWAVYMAAFIVSICMLLSIVTLRIVYEAKIDGATAHIPEDGMVTLRISIGQQLYDADGEKYASQERAVIKIEDKTYFDGDCIRVNLQEEYPIRVIYMESDVNGELEDTITFTGEDIYNTYTIMKKVEIAEPETEGEYAVVVIRFEYGMEFWDVIFY